MDEQHFSWSSISRQWCHRCEGSCIQPSILYLIPFWPKMLCKKCNGSGLYGISRLEIVLVHQQAANVLRCANIGDQNFIECLNGDDAKELRYALVSLSDAFKESDDPY